MALVILAMEQKEIANYNNLSLDHTLVRTPKEVSTPSLINKNPTESLQNTKSPSSISLILLK